MTINIVSGFNWDLEVLNSEADSYYTGLPNMDIPTAREDFRLPSNISEAEIKTATTNADIGYCMNAPCLGSMENMVESRESWIEFLGWLEDVGFYEAMIANPYLIPIAEEHTNMKIDVSVIAEVNTIQKIEHYRNMGADKINIGYEVQRNFNFLERLDDYPDMDFQLIANAACVYSCPIMKFHWDMQGHTSEKVDSDWPYRWCRGVTLENFPEESLKAQFYRPKDLDILEDYNVDYVKLSGRTMGTEWMIKTADAYANRKAEHTDNYFDLTPLVRGTLDKEEGAKILYLNLDALDGFMEELRRKKPNCRVVCQWDCNICGRWADKLKEEGDAEIQSG